MAGIINAIDIAGQGLSTQRSRLNVIAQNMANAETVETKEGGPYRRKQVIVSEDETRKSFRSVLAREHGKLARTHSGHIAGRTTAARDDVELSGVKSKEEVDPEASFRLVYEPGHPKADEDGYVKMPDVNVINEMVDMMSASRAYEANTTVISTAKKMAADAMDI